MRPLGPVAPEGVHWMHFPNVASALRHLHSPARGSLTKLHHSQVSQATKSSATHDGWAFTLEELPSVTAAVAASLPSPSPLQAGAAPRSLTSFFLVAVLCPCCAANICGTEYTCTRCHQVVDEASMQVVIPSVHCFLCTCRACGNEVSSHTIECKGCHFRVHVGCTTDGICTRLAVRVPPSNVVPKRHKFKTERILTRLWLRYDAMCVLMWCAACRAHPQHGT